MQLLSGDGRGGFAPTLRVGLPGTLTAFTTGEINRRDGLMDVVIGARGLIGQAGAQILVFEGPGGALKAEPEVFNLPETATSLALGFLDEHYAGNLAVAAEHELHIIYGRDRKLSLDAREKATVPIARRDKRRFGFRIRSLTIGDFVSDSRSDLALLSDDGSVHLLSENATEPVTGGKAGHELDEFLTTILSNGTPGNGPLELSRVTISGSTKDDLLIRDTEQVQLRLFAQGRSNEGANKGPTTTLDVEGEPAAVLPMRLDADALNDLLILRTGNTKPAVVLTQEQKADPGGTFRIAGTFASLLRSPSTAAPLRRQRQRRILLP